MAMFATRGSFPLITLLYVLIFLHALVLILCGAYTYARVPLGAWVQQAFDLSRNPYDRLGHFMQGFVSALVAREILIRGVGYCRAAVSQLQRVGNLLFREPGFLYRFS